jgi:ATP-binding cassette subfamily C protein
LLFLLLMVARALLLYRRDVMIARLDAEYTADLRLRAASALADGGWKRASRLGLSGMQSLLLTEIPRAVYAVAEAQRAAIAVFMLLVQFGVALLLSPQLALVAVLIIAGGLSASWTLLRKGRERGLAMSDFGEQSSAAGYRLHAGLKAALAQGTIAAFLRQYRRNLELLSTHVWGFSRDLAWTRAMAGTGAAVAAVILIVAGQQWLELPFTILATLLLLFARMTGPAQSLQQAFHGISGHAPAFEAIERGVGVLGETKNRDKADVPPLAWRELRLRGVTYAHADSGFALDVAELNLEAGEWLGIAGPSGGGKTTLADIAAGLVEPDAGKVEIDGRRLDEALLPSWRRGLSYVGQNEQPFEGTVRQNLLAGSEEREDDRALWDALDAVGLAERVRSSEAALDMAIGDRGSALSGGERQRLAIARALLRRPRLIVLDEATNALDPAGEIALLKRLRDRLPAASLILIAHRAAPLELCDRVVTVECGRLV